MTLGGMIPAAMQRRTLLQAAIAAATVPTPVLIQGSSTAYQGMSLEARMRVHDYILRRAEAWYRKQVDRLFLDGSESFGEGASLFIEAARETGSRTA